MDIFDSTGFFEGLSFIGWLGILVWVGFFLLMVFRGKYFTSYDERKPKIDIWEEYLYEEWHYFVFMAVRFFLIVVILLVITRIMFRI